MCLHGSIFIISWIFFFLYITYFPRRQLCISCVFTSPALVVPPEVNADQRRGALLFPAGLWRAAAGDSLRSDHLQPVWRRLLAQRDGVSIKSQISHTACVENGDEGLKQATKHTALYLKLFKKKCDVQLFILYSKSVWRPHRQQRCPPQPRLSAPTANTDMLLSVPPLIYWWVKMWK